jgi:hypothetical protein
VIKVPDLVWLEFEKPDLAGAEAFAHAFGFATAVPTDDQLQLCGNEAGALCMTTRRGRRTAYSAPPSSPRTRPGMMASRAACLCVSA